MSQGITTYIISSTAPDTTSVRDFVSLDTRSREIGHRSGLVDYDPVQLTIVRQYASSNGVEYFISVEDQLGYLYGFTRLCCPSSDGIADRPGLGESTAMIRELHVYGQLASLHTTQNRHEYQTPLAQEMIHHDEVKQESSIDQQDQASQDPTTNTQHTGIGRQLMKLAEAIAHHQGYSRLSVISGVGVRGYYQLLGYTLENTYMVKDLSNTIH